MKQEWENKSYRDRVNEIGKSDLLTVLEAYNSGDYNTYEALNELHRMQMANIDLCLKEDKSQPDKKYIVKQLEDIIHYVKK